LILKRLKDLREDNDLTQEYVGKLLNVVPRTYSGYETGTRSISIEALIKLAKFYNVSLDYIVELTDDPTPYKRDKKDV
jgi:transcriptional regulator with XRE-family HTH domain